LCTAPAGPFRQKTPDPRAFAHAAFGLPRILPHLPISTPMVELALSRYTDVAHHIGGTYVELELTGKVAIISGASKGIGRAIALALAREGMRLALAARSTELLNALAREITATGTRAIPIPLDLTKPSSCEHLVVQTVVRFGRLDLLVNNAGSAKRGDFLTLTDDDWADGYALKFMAAVRLSRAAWPHLVESHGCIINIAGVGGRSGSHDFTIGGSVNAALMYLTKSLADRGVHDDVRVNAINPGFVQTQRLKARIEHHSQQHSLPIEEAARHIAVQAGITRFGKPEEIADIVTFLASGKSTYVQGALIDVDGGMTRGI
jgi:NAD(P)-dependent dehydrogenase (short-subunit alcohol dehydrogenase family)